jgi:hypothetical protein
MYRLITILLLVVSLPSCCEKKIYCSSQVLDFAFTGFDRSEVRSFTLRRFKKGDQWGPVLDSVQYIYYGQAPVTSRPDTLPFADYRTVGNINGISAGNDWAIYLPATRKTYFITSIFTDEKKSQLVRCGDDITGCSSAITNFAINENWQNGGFVFIQKGKW